jgi:16S rRNA G966 N2-methylase RsmD
MPAAKRTKTNLDVAPRYVDYVPLADVQLAPRNAKGHAADAINKSIGHFGFAELPLLDERTGRLVAGHGRHEQLVAMHTAGGDPPDGVRVDDTGTWFMPVIRGWASRSDADADADAYLIASNQLTTKGGWEDRGLAEILEELQDAHLLELTGFDDDDLTRLLDDIASEEPEPTGAGGDADSVPDAPADPVSKPGDLWLLGRHRLLCGDATNPDDIDRVRGGEEPSVIYTDPPYGISIVKGTGKVGHHPGMPFGGRVGGGLVVPTTKYLPVAGDDTTDVAADTFRLLTTMYPSARHVWWGGNHYAGSAGLPDASCWLIWDKENNGHFADAELAWTNHPGAVRLLRHMWNGMLRASERGGGVRVHPTQKPVALAEWAFSVVDSDNERRVVLDVFAGSGSTLIAAHRTDRTALLIEMEPHYVDVICRRFQESTSTLPVLESTGEEHDFTTTDD